MKLRILICLCTILFLTNTLSAQETQPSQESQSLKQQRHQKKQDKKNKREQGKQPQTNASSLEKKADTIASNAAKYGAKEVETKQIKRLVKRQAKDIAAQKAKNAAPGTHKMVRKAIKRAIKEAARQESNTNCNLYCTAAQNGYLNIINSDINYSIGTNQNILISKNDTFIKIAIAINYSHSKDTFYIGTPEKMQILVDTTFRKIEKIDLRLFAGNLPNSPNLVDSELAISLHSSDSISYTDTIYPILKCSKINFDTLGNLCKYSGRIYIDSNKTDFIYLSLYDNKKIAQSKLQIFGALYSTPGTIKADDPNLTQTYIRFNIPIKELHGIDYDAPFSKRFIFFRNIFTQLTYTTNANNTNYIDSTSFSTNKLMPRGNYNFPPLDTANQARHVNRLDLLENANFNLNVTLPVLTYVIPQFKGYKGDFAHVYLEPFCSLLSTVVSRPNDTTTNVTVYSLQPGFDIGMRTEHMLLSGVPLFLELTAKMFWIIPLSNSVSPDLNYQYSRINDYNITVPGKHLLDPSNHPYYNFDGLIMYNTNKDNSDSSSNVFVHFSFFTNITHPTSSASGHVFNNFMQLQVGYGLNISTFISQIQKKATSSSTTGANTD